MAHEPSDALGGVAAFPRGLADVPGAALERGAFGTSLLNRDGVILDVNDEFARMLGYERGELIDRNLLEIVHPDDHRLIARIHRAMRVGRMESDQTRRLYLRKDGEILHAVAGVVALRGPDGRLVGILKQVQDVTRRVRAERDLQQSLARQRLILDALAEGVIVYDAEGRARVSNPSAREILGVSAETLHGHRPQAPIRLADDDGTPIEDASLPVRQALRSGRPVEGHVFKLDRDDGQVRWIRVKAQPLVHPGGDETMVVASVADVTALKMRERELVHRDLHDPLTGLPNRRFFLGHLARRAAGRSPGGHAGGAVSVLELARLERINDLYGRDVGERLLREAAVRIAGAAGPADVVARVGWGAFAAYLPDAGDAEAAASAARCLADAMAAPVTVRGIPMAVGVDVGVAMADAGERAAAALLDRAEAALRRARQGTPNGPVAFRSDADEAVRRSIRLGRDLARAREHDELGVAYDPIVRLDDGATVGDRGRLCWRHPSEGEIDAETTRELARMGGLGPELCRWSLGACLERIGSLGTARDRAVLTLSVSPDMLLAHGVERFRDLLSDTGVRPGALVLAVDADDDAEEPRLAEAASAVGRLGFGLMLEHGGQRRTRVRSASEFPYQWLGVHRSAIARGLREGGGRAITRGVLRSLRDAGVRTLAETEGDAAFSAEALRSLGFDYRCGPSGAASGADAQG